MVESRYHRGLIPIGTVVIVREGSSERWHGVHTVPRIPYRGIICGYDDFGTKYSVARETSYRSGKFRNYGDYPFVKHVTREQDGLHVAT